MLPHTHGEQQRVRHTSKHQQYTYTSSDELWILFADDGDGTDCHDK
jgi:hypothetical protein